ncbi:MAG: hypothetical protein IKS71_00620, partial [Bacteroidales bacterium]|nr:hypothetical protein [Bacteroidales bacterium]
MLGYLLAPFIQVSTVLGTPLVGAKIYVYLSNSTTLATTYSDFQSHLNPNPVITDALGHATVIADDSTAYDVEIRDSCGVLLMSQKNLTVGGSGGGSGDIPVEAGYGIEVVRTEGAYTVSVDTDVVATHDDLVGKQDRLSAGDNIAIENNVVSVTGKKDLQVQSPINFIKTSSALRLYLDTDFVNTATAELTAGTCLKKEAGVISVDTDSTVSGTQNLVGGHNNTVDGLQNIVGGFNNTVTAYFDGDSTTETEASLVVGDTNTVEGAFESAVIGVRNSLTNQETAFVFGSWNTLMDGETNVVFGDDNYVDYDGQYNFVAGSNNELAEESCSNSLFGQSIRIGSNSENNFVGGSENDIGDECRSCFVFGRGIELDDECLYNAVFGIRQTVGPASSGDDATYAMLVSGMDNTVGSSGYGEVVGSDNTVKHAQFSFVSGFDNEVTSVESVTVLGGENSVTGSTASIVGGQSNNVVDGSSSIISGEYNVSTKATACILAGTNNTISHSNDHQSSNCVVVGNTNDVFASQSVVAGRNNEVGNFST